MTLKGYYNSLPDATYPKKEFVRLLMEKTGASHGSINNWVVRGGHPSNPEHVRILSEVTGIPENELWLE